MDNMYREAADPPEECSPKKKKMLCLDEKTAVVIFRDKPNLNHSFTYKPCSSWAAVLQLGHVSELTGKENVLRDHWDLRMSNTPSSVKYICYVKMNMTQKVAQWIFFNSRVSPGKANPTQTPSAVCSGSTFLHIGQAAFSYKETIIFNRFLWWEQKVKQCKLKLYFFHILLLKWRILIEKISTISTICACLQTCPRVFDILQWLLEVKKWRKTCTGAAGCLMQFYSRAAEDRHSPAWTRTPPARAQSGWCASFSRCYSTERTHPAPGHSLGQYKTVFNCRAKQGYFLD